MRSVAAVLLLAAFLSSGCANSSDRGDESDSDGKPNKFDQTWSKAYSRTTCREWRTQMNQHEQFVAAADMLTGARHVDDPDSGLPPDDLIERFADAVSTACAIPSAKLAEIGASEYLVDRALFRP